MQRHFILRFPPSIPADQAASVVAPFGVRLDATFPAVVVDPSSGAYVLRGLADLSRLGALKALGIEAFADPRIGPAHE